MANMSYCRFENTSGDLGDCVWAMNEDDFSIKALNDYEKRGIKAMYSLCQEFIERYEELMENEEDDLFEDLEEY